MKHLFKTCLFVISYFFFAAIALAKDGKHDAFTVTVTGHGQPVILIPGATCGGDEWKETLAHLGSKYECHVITIAGYAGVAPMAAGPYLETVKNQLEQYITGHKLEHVILVGHTIGGFLSLWVAAEMKTHLDKVLILDAMPFFAATNNPNAPDTFSEVQANNMFLSYSQMSDSALKANQLVVAKFMCLDSARWGQITEWGARSDKRTMAYTMTEMLTHDLRKQIADIKVPVLVLAAYAKLPQYPQFTREVVTDMYAGQYKLCTACTVHVAEDHTRHFIMYDNPAWLYKEMDAFFNTKS